MEKENLTRALDIQDEIEMLSRLKDEIEENGVIEIIISGRPRLVAPIKLAQKIKALCVSYFSDEIKKKEKEFDEL